MSPRAQALYDAAIEFVNRGAESLSGSDYDEFLGELFADIEARIDAREEEGNPE